MSATIGFTIALLASACAPPTERFAERANRISLARTEVRGGAFRHAIFSRDISPAATRVHVYISGDGSPARAARFDPPDPTPDRDIAPDLMALDPGPRLLLGRPCHHGVEACDPIDFTLGRYSESVVASMVEALDAFRREQRMQDDAGWVLIGFSGGGTLAVLIAERLDNVQAVITIAGNLDPDAWAEHHGYAPLQASLNPSRRESLPSGILQFHLVGLKDANVPPKFARTFLDRQHRAREIKYPDFTHACCWDEAWTSTLQDLDAALFH